MKALVALILIAAVGFLVFKTYGSPKEIFCDSTREVCSYETGTVEIRGKTITVDLANKPIQQIRGLSGREGLDENTGMLFVFDKPEIHLFWMKDMLFSIDMIWIDEQNKIIHIERDVTPATFPERFGPNEPVKYVLEVNSGFSDSHHWRVGDTVTVSGVRL